MVSSLLNWDTFTFCKDNISISIFDVTAGQNWSRLSKIYNFSMFEMFIDFRLLILMLTKNAASLILERPQELPDSVD